MNDLKKRIKAIEKRLDLDGQDEVIIVRPAKYPDETDVEYLARINERTRDISPRRVVRSGSVTIEFPTC